MAQALVGKVAVVTGAGRGIGRAAAIAIAASGAHVMLASRTSHELELTAAACAETGGRCEWRPTDVGDEHEVQILIEETHTRLGRVDVLVNAAGVIGPIGPMAGIDMDSWAKTLLTNVVGTARLCRLVLPEMLEQRAGSIINFSGGGATAPRPRFSAYAASKAAVVRLTETIAEEVAGTGVRVNAIAPGMVDTKMQDEVLAAGVAAGEEYEIVTRMRRSGAGGSPAELAAELVVYLASAQSAGLTGRLISAPHDPWREWGPADHRRLRNSPWYTLRRIDPHTIQSLDAERQ